MELSSRRFEVVRRIGAGGCGEVFEARDRERGGIVALKTLPRLEPGALARFKREFRSLADVSHPALLPLYELFEENGAWFFTMELVDGVDFLEWTCGEFTSHATREVLASEVRAKSDAEAVTLAAGAEPTLQVITGNEATAVRPQRAHIADPDRLRDVLRQLVEGVAALHLRGLVHRDLKPSNVLVDRTGRIRILDFGLVAERAGSGEGISGTPAYMSPEQASGRPTDAPSDWYAIGVMIFEALTGRLPFEGPALRILVDKQRLDAPAPSSLGAVDPLLEQLCVSMLSRDPAARPSAARTLSLLGTPARYSNAPPARTDLLVGRDREMKTLESAFVDAASSAVVVRIRGESGAGKSHLAQRFIDEIRGRARVFATRCFERERVPYVALDGIVDQIAGHLGKLGRADAAALVPPGFAALRTVFPVLADLGEEEAPILDPHELRRAAVHALRNLIAAFEPRPIVLYVDDAQWGDADSVPYFAELMRLPSLLVVLTERNDAPGGFVSGLAEQGLFDAARTLDLGALSPADVVELVRAVAGPSEIARARAEEISQESGGNAMLVAELAARVHARAGLSLEELILGRVAELPASASALLEVVALAGAPVAREIAERAAGTAGESVAAVRALTTARLVRVTGERDARRLAAYHDRIREAAVGAMSDDSRRAGHLALANAHEASEGASPEVLSLHLHAAGAHARAVPYTLAAARRAASALAFGRAAELFGEAVLHASADDPERPARLTELGDALKLAGRGADAASAYLQAAPALDTRGAIELRRRAVEQLLRCGYVERGQEEMRVLLAELDVPARENRALALASLFFNHLRLDLRGRSFVERAERDIDPLALVRVDTFWAIGSGLVLIDPLQGLEFFGRGVLEALALGEPTRIARAFAHEATYEVRSGPRGLPAARERLRQANALLDRANDPMMPAIVAASEGVVCYLCGLFREALAASDRSEQLGGGLLGVGWERELILRFKVKSHHYLGSLDELVAIVDPAVELAIDRRDLYAEVSLLVRGWYMARLVRDEAAGVHAVLDEAIARWPGKGLFLQSYFDLMARTEVDLYLGDVARARERIEKGWRSIARMQLLRGHSTRSEALHARARAALGVGELGHARSLAKALSDPHAPWAEGLSALVRGLAEPRTERAIAELERAENVLAGADMELYAAAARWRRGELISGDEGAGHVASARARFVARGVVCPERMLQVFAPRPERVEKSRSD